MQVPPDAAGFGGKPAEKNDTFVVYGEVKWTPVSRQFFVQFKRHLSNFPRRLSEVKTSPLRMGTTITARRKGVGFRWSGFLPPPAFIQPSFAAVYQNIFPPVSDPQNFDEAVHGYKNQSIALGTCVVAQQIEIRSHKFLHTSRCAIAAL